MMEENLFNVVGDTHVSVGHGGWTKILKERNLMYKNIKVEAMTAQVLEAMPILSKESYTPILKENLNLYQFAKTTLGPPNTLLSDNDDVNFVTK